jgi:hypothetical protein
MRASHVGLRLVAAAALLVVAGAVAPLALGGQAKTVKVDARVVFRTAKFPAKNDPRRCLAVAFAQFSSVRGATSYAVQVRGYKGSGNVDGGGPPFPQDTYRVTVSKRTTAFRAPVGKHWFVLGTSSTGQGCPSSLAGLKGRFAIARATATVR